MLQEKYYNLNLPFAFSQLELGKTRLANYYSNFPSNRSGKCPVVFVEYQYHKDYDTGLGMSLDTKLIVESIVADSLDISYKLNEETDSGTISLLYDGNYICKDEQLTEKLPNRSKVYILYDYDGTNTFESDGYGKPLNYDCFIIGGGSVVSWDGYYSHAYQLVEPIELWKNIIVDTNSFTNLTSITVDGTTYTKDATNAYSCLVRELEICGLNNRVQIDSELRTILENTAIGENFVFQDENLYNIVFKLCARAKVVPVLVFNAKYTASNLGAEYILTYESMLGTETTIEESFENVHKISLSDFSNVYASKGNSVISNMVSSKSMVTNINKECVRYLQYDTGSLELDNSFSNFENAVLKLPQPIYKGDQITIDTTLHWLNIPLASYTDVIEDFLNKEEWSVLSNITSQRYNPYFEVGSDVIHIGQFIKYTESDRGFVDDYVDIAVQCSYYPLLSCKVVNGEVNGYEESITQTESTVNDIEIGIYNEEYASKMGGLVVQFGKIVDNYSDIYQVGQILETDEYGALIVVKVDVKAKSNCYEVCYTCNSEMPMRSNVVNIDYTKDLSLIAMNSVYERKMNFCEKLKVKMSESMSITPNSEWKHISLNRVGWIDSFLNSFTYSSIINTDFIYILTNNDYYPSYRYLRFPLAKAIYGNSLCFNVNTRTNRLCWSGGMGKASRASFLVSKPTMQGKSYTDVFGCIHSFFETVIGSDDVIETDIDTMNDNYPYCEQTTFSSVATNQSFIDLKTFTIKKDTKEILNFTFQMKFEGDTGITIYPYFLKYSGLVSGLGTKTLKVANGIYTRNLTATEVANARTLDYLSIQSHNLLIELATPITCTKGYSIITSDGELLLTKKFVGSTSYIYITLSK